MIVLTESQARDLRSLRELCHARGSEAVIIGAVAYQIFFEDVERKTHDVDVAVALDLDEFSVLVEDLRRHGWRRQHRREHRWRSPNNSIVDLLPAGARLRAAGEIVWPESGFSMSLAAFDHVFEDSIAVEVAPGLTFKVAPPAVLALLKMAAYLDDPQIRRKDLDDLREMFTRYEAESDRVFSEVVFEAELTDIEFAGAFLLGRDVRAIASQEDSSLVVSFLDRLQGDEMDDEADDHGDREELRLQRQMFAFRKGFRE